MLKVHVTEFLAYCKVVGFSPSSRESLTASLREFDAFIQTQPVEVQADITYSLLADFVADYSEPSVHKKKARVWCLHQFYHFLFVTGIIRVNIALGLPYPKIEKTVPFFLTANEYNRIIDYFGKDADTSTGFRNLLMVLILGMLGLRTATLIALNIEHIDLAAGLVWVHEKGGRQRHMVLPTLLVKVLEDYLARLDTDNGPLFLSTRKKRISPRTLQDVLRTAATELGIDRPIHPRLFRHTAATLLNKAAGTTVTQAVLGHARRFNTMRYAHLNPDQYALYMKSHPFMKESRS